MSSPSLGRQFTELVNVPDIKVLTSSPSRERHPAQYNKPRAFSFSLPLGSVDQAITPPERVAVPAPAVPVRPDPLFVSPLLLVPELSVSSPRSRSSRTWSFSNPVEEVPAKDSPQSLAANRSLSGSAAIPFQMSASLDMREQERPPAVLRQVPQARFRKPTHQNVDTDLREALLGNIAMPTPQRPDSAPPVPIARPMSTPMILQLEAAASSFEIRASDPTGSCAPKRLAGHKRLSHARSISLTGL